MYWPIADNPTQAWVRALPSARQPHWLCFPRSPPFSRQRVWHIGFVCTIRFSTRAGLLSCQAEAQEPTSPALAEWAGAETSSWRQIGFVFASDPHFQATKRQIGFVCHPLPATGASPGPAKEPHTPAFASAKLVPAQAGKGAHREPRDDTDVRAARFALREAIPAIVWCPYDSI